MPLMSVTLHPAHGWNDAIVFPVSKLYSVTSGPFPATNAGVNLKFVVLVTGVVEPICCALAETDTVCPPAAPVGARMKSLGLPSCAEYTVAYVLPAEVIDGGDASVGAPG